MNWTITLHAASYKNIGPFAHKTLSVVFHRGKYLIKAPIGSWKSFLFFDGPLYWLYKYSSRKMVNAKCDSAVLSLLFTSDDVHYLIVRKLKAWKSKDRCQSQLYVMGDLPQFSDNVIIKDLDIRDLIVQQGISMEEQVFKNESDIQQTLGSILPPREVFASTVFLMQDAPNIFEMVPAERIEVFKNVFGMLGIDEAKTQIAEKRRTIQATRKVKADTQQYQHKLQQYIQTITTHYMSIKNSPALVSSLAPWKETIQEWIHLEDKLQIMGFSLMGIDVSVIESTKNILAQVSKKYEKMKVIYDQQQTHYIQEQKKIKDLESRLSELTQLLLDNQRKLDWFDEQSLETLKQQKQQTYQKLTQLEQQIPFATIAWFVAKSPLFAEYFDTTQQQSIADVHHAIRALIEKWKHLAEQKKNLSVRLDDTKKQEKIIRDQFDQLAFDQEGTRAYSSFQREIRQQQTILQQQLQQQQTEQKRWEEKQKDFEKRREWLDKKIQWFDNSIASASLFHCEKIQSDCPYIQLINNKSLKDLQQQKKVLENELTLLLEEFDYEDCRRRLATIQNEQTVLQQQQRQLTQTPQEVLVDFVATIQEQRTVLKQKLIDADFAAITKTCVDEIAQIEKTTWLIKEFMVAIAWQDVLWLFDESQQLQATIKKLDDAIVAWDALYKKMSSIKDAIISQKKEQELTQKMLETQQKLLVKIAEDRDRAKKSLDEIDYDHREQDQKHLAQIEQAYHQLADLISDYKISQRDVDNLIAQEKRLHNLYTIFSKELLLVVLQTALPTLNEIINSYLVQVVDYTLHMKITEDNDKLAMHAIIEDEKGEREISSLSGGQKTILKLVWMLSVASYMRSTMLFLDETINNLDRDTVGQVADMLHDFIQQHTISFYTVTHSEQIQQMGIWDGVITFEGMA